MFVFCLPLLSAMVDVQEPLGLTGRKRIFPWKQDFKGWIGRGTRLEIEVEPAGGSKRGPRAAPAGLI